VGVALGRGCDSRSMRLRTSSAFAFKRSGGANSEARVFQFCLI
jgi:hypothetical protein